MTENIANASLTASNDRSMSKAANLTAWVLQALVALAFLSAGGSKVAGAPPMVALFDKLGVGQWFRILTGLLEVVSALALLIPRTTFYGAVLLAVVMIGAVITHLTVLGGNPAPAIIFLALAGVIAHLRRP